VTDGNRQLSTDLRRPQPNITSVDIFRDERQEYQNNNHHTTHPLSDYIRIALVHRKLVTSVALTLIALATIFSYLATPLYTAETEIGIGAYSPTVKGTGLEESIAKQSEKQDYLETQIKQITRLTLADKMLADKEIGEEIKTYLNSQTSILGSITGIFSKLFSSGNEKIAEPESGSSYQHPIGMLKSYLGLVAVSPVKRTFLVKISATTSSPELSAKIANTHSLNFIELAKEEKQKTALTNLVFLRSQAEELASKVAVIEQDIAKYAEENAIVALTQDENIVLRKMSELNNLLTESTGKRIKSESSYNEAKEGGNISSSSNDSRGLEDLKLRLRDKEGEYANMGQKFKAAYPAMVQLKAEIDSLKNSLQSQEKLMLRTAEAQYKSDLASEEELKRELEMQKSKAFDLSRRSVKYNSMKREFDSLRDLHQSVLRQLKEAQISAESEVNNITLSDKAAIPQAFSSPKRTRNIMLAMLLGPILGFLLAILLEVLNNTIETPDQIQKILQLPSLGVIPSFDSEGSTTQPEALTALTNQSLRALEQDSNSSDEPSSANSTIDQTPALASQIENSLITVTAPFSATSEAFRAVRTSILLSSADNPPRLVLITSSRKGEGKTTLSCNLALTIAGTVKSLVIIDSDLRRSSVHKHFGIANDAPGLVEYLTGMNQLEEVIHKTAHPKVFVVPAGIKPPNPAELLGSKKMADLLQDLKEKFEFVLIDSPPVLPVTDAVLLSRVVDGVIMVVRGQKTEQNIARDAKNKITQVGGKILGVILNGVDVKRGQHYYYYKDSYTEYYGEEDDTKKKGGLKFWGRA
jgi:succinoglycan biosynthesis transport protein ExoP